MTKGRIAAAHGRYSLYFTGCPFPQNCPFPWGIWTSSNTWFLGPTKSRAPSPIFGPFLLWPNGWMHQDATWYGCRPQPRGLCVRWRPSASLPKRGQSPPNFRLMFIVAKRLDGWMSLGTKVGLSPGDSVFDGDPAPSPIFSQFLLWPNGWMHQDATWYRGRPPPRGLCVT